MTDKKLNMILMHLLLVALVLLVNTGSVKGQKGLDDGVSTGNTIQCGKVGDTNVAFIQIQQGISDGDSNSDGTYAVKYTFDWGVASYTTFTELPFGVETTVNSTNVYEIPGVYDTGYTVEFCDADGTCGGLKTYSTDLLKIDDDSCEWGYTTPSPSATVEPSSAPTNALSPTVGSSSSDLYSLFPALTISILAMILS